VAPVPASAVLSGVMIKAGLLGWLRFLPMGQETGLPGWGGALVLLGLLAAFYGVIIGLTQREVKTILAYSSISQMGVMTMLVGCGLLAPDHGPQVTWAVSIYALHHGLAKASLILATGMGTAKGSRNAASGHLWLLLLPALSLAGLPFTSGAIAKFVMKEVVHALPAPWMGILTFLLPLTALATTLIVCHFLKQIAAGLPHQAAPSPAMRLSWLLLWLSSGLLPWVWPQQPAYASQATEAALLWQGLWPVVAGGMIMMLSWRWWPAASHRTVPAGDLLWLVWPSHKELAIKGEAQEEKRLYPERKAGGRARQLLDFFLPQGRRLEKKLRRWSMVGAAYLLLCLLFLVMLIR
jgi:formate hydrogenlyase subunit 3/multisubunit Na+/H+ antiporter MnhD subunit